MIRNKALPDPTAISNVVISVPHSGTRTLQQYLETERGLGPVKHYHFNLHPVDIATFLQRRGVTGYVPLRNPFDIADSWRRRYPTDRSQSPALLNEALIMMIEYVDKYSDNIELVKMEDLPVLAGVGPEDDVVPEEFQQSARCRELRQFLLTNERVEDFYRVYYDDDELWWL